jgi:ATP-dependent DNA helicase RecG
MKPSLQKLQKIFKLEAERGYDNRAVLGGLDRILDSWEVEARADGLPEELIQAISTRLRDYPRLSESSRAEALDGLMRRIQKEAGGPPPITISPPAPREKLEAEVEKTTHPGHLETIPAEALTTPALSREENPPQFQPSPVQPSAPSREESAALDASIIVLPSVGPRHASTLSRLGISTLRDMLYYFPRRYDDYTQLKPINRLWYGEEVTVIGTVQNIVNRTIRSGHFQVVEALVSDGTGALRITWFNQPWIAKRLRSGAQIALSGKIDQYLGRLVLNNPEWEPLEQQQLNTNRIVPVYPLAGQITQRWMRRLMNQVITHWAPRVLDPLPEELRRSAGLVDLSQAMLQVHFPDSWEQLKAARHRLAFDEIFLMQLGVLRQKRAWQERTARAFETDEAWLEAHSLSQAPNKAPSSISAATWLPADR